VQVNPALAGLGVVAIQAGVRENGLIVLEEINRSCVKLSAKTDCECVNQQEKGRQHKNRPFSNNTGGACGFCWLGIGVSEEGVTKGECRRGYS
jgi:hypothetical protein